MTPRADFAARTPSLRALWLTLALAAAMVLAAPAARAGRSCEAHALTPQSVARGLQLAERTQQALDASGAQVVLLARAGQDLSRYGVRWSHLGIAYRQPDAASPGGSVWRVLHKLNQCGSAEAAVYRQGLGDFFLDDLWRFEAAWVVPTPEVQQQLLALLLDGSDACTARPGPAPQALQHRELRLEPDLPAVQPVGHRDAGAGDGAVHRGGAGRAGREPPARPGLAAVQGLCAGGAHDRAADPPRGPHDGSQRGLRRPPEREAFADRIETVTVDSVFAWMPRAGLGAAPVRLALP
jgi:hypothetical protein